MYIVVSYWQAKPGRGKEFEEKSLAVGSILRQQAGVKFVEAFKSGENFVAVHAYQDEATYQKLVQDPNGPFAKAMESNKVEELGQWLRSESGASLT